jgi:hypothetical protein
MAAVVWLKVWSGNGSSGVRTMRWLVALECEMTRMTCGGHVAANAVIAWRRGLARSVRRGTTGLAMAGEALGLEISRGFRLGGFDVRIVTADAT